MESEVEGEVFNVGNPANICSIKELAELVVELTGSKSEISYVDPTILHGKNFPFINAFIFTMRIEYSISRTKSS